MTNLANAPLVYMIGIVRFPRLPDHARYITEYHEAIRAEYPLTDDIMTSMVSATIGPEGMRIDQHETKMFQFASVDRQWAFIFTDSVLGLHTASYETHQDFVNRFRRGLDALLRVSDIGIAWLEAVGIRYVDLVVPREGEGLRDYLNPWVVPDDAPVVSAGLSLIEGMSVATYGTEAGALRFQALRNPPTTLPPELDTLLVQRNGWKRVVPDGEFAVMDIDHGCRFDPPTAMDIDFVCDRLLALRKVAKGLFNSAGTPFALKVWKGEA